MPVSDVVLEGGPLLEAELEGDDAIAGVKPEDELAAASGGGVAVPAGAKVGVVLADKPRVNLLPGHTSSMAGDGAGAEAGQVTQR